MFLLNYPSRFSTCTDTVILDCTSAGSYAIGQVSARIVPVLVRPAAKSAARLSYSVTMLARIHAMVRLVSPRLSPRQLKAEQKNF